MVDLCKKKRKRGLPFGVQLPRDGMKILQWSSNPKLPSKNIPLPPERDPDLFACRAGAGRGWAARTGGQAGDRQTGSGRWEEWSGAIYRPGVTTEMRFCTVRGVAQEYFQIGPYCAITWDQSLKSHWAHSSCLLKLKTVLTSQKPSFVCLDFMTEGNNEASRRV